MLLVLLCINFDFFKCKNCFTFVFCFLIRPLWGLHPEPRYFSGVRSRVTFQTLPTMPTHLWPFVIV